MEERIFPPWGESILTIALLARITTIAGLLAVARSASRVLQAVAVARRFQNMAVVRQAIQHGSSESLTAKHLRPLLERQIGRDDDALLFISPTDDFKEQFRTGFGERNVTQFIQDQQIEAAELFEEPFEPAVFSGFQQPGHQGRHAEEPHPPPIMAGGQPANFETGEKCGLGVPREKGLFHSLSQANLPAAGRFIPGFSDPFFAYASKLRP